LPGIVIARKRVRVRPALPVVLLSGILGVLPAGSAHADAAKGQAGRVLKALVVRPADANAACSLAWRSRPHWLRPESRLLGTVLAGWIGTDSGITPESLRLGISGVYFESETSTLALIGLAMKTEEDAVRAEKTLVDRYDKKTANRFMRRGSYVVILAVPPPGEEKCSSWMWEEIGRRLGKVAS
jgi:hypothetical protein